MLVISSAELSNNLKKHLDLAKNQSVVIQRDTVFFFTIYSFNGEEEYLVKYLTINMLSHNLYNIIPFRSFYTQYVCGLPYLPFL